MTPARAGGRQMVRDLFLLSGGELLGKIIGFVAFAYLARTLAPAAYGAVELAVSFSLLFALIVDFGLGPIGARDVARDPSRVTELAADVPSARFAVTAVAIPVMGGMAMLMGQPDVVVWLVWMFALALLAVPLHQQWLFQGLEMMEWVSVAQVLRMSVFSASVVVLVRSAGDLLWVGAAELAAAFALAAFYVIAQGRLVTPMRLSMRPAALAVLLREGLPMGSSQVVWALNQYVPTLLIAIMASTVEVAFFGAAHRIVVSIATFGVLYHFNLFPAVSSALATSAESYQRLVGPSFKATAWGGIGIALVISLAADAICRLVYGEQFALAGTTLAILIWMIPLMLFSGHARWALTARGHQRYVLVAQVAGAAVTMGAGGWAIARWGAVGGAVAMVSSALVVWFVANGYARAKVTRLPFLAATVRPAAAALGIWLAARALVDTPWLAAAGAGLAYATLGPLLDRRLLADLRSLARAKGSRPAAAVASPTTVGEDA